MWAAFEAFLREHVEPLRQITTYPSRTVISALQRHQIRQSADSGGDPSPSGSTEYAIEAIARHGLLLGGSKACWRALRTGSPHLDSHESS